MSHSRQWFAGNFRQTIVGYVTYVYPDPLERWSEGNMENLIELGAIEVIPAFRGHSVGKTLLAVSMISYSGPLCSLNT